jgi:fumarate hydratase class II
MPVTAPAPHSGGERAAVIAHSARVEGLNLRGAALARGRVSAADCDRRVAPATLPGAPCRD